MDNELARELVETSSCDCPEHSAKTSPSQQQQLLEPTEINHLPDGAFVTVLGMLFHCAADGFAFGASGYSQSFLN